MFRKTLGVVRVAKDLRTWGGGLKLTGNPCSAQALLSLRAMLQIHGAARDELAQIAGVISRDLRVINDTPTVAGYPDAPKVFSQVNAFGAAVVLASERLSVLAVQLGGTSKECTDCLLKPLVSSLPQSLALYGGSCSGFMIARNALP